MQRSFNHEITFQGANALAIQEIADSLVANEQIIFHVGQILEELFEGLTIEKISVQFRSVSVNSPLKETLVVTILSQFQPQINEVTKQIVKDITGVEMSDGYSAIVTVLFLIVLIYGIDWAYKKFKAPKEFTRQEDKSTVSITGDYNNILQVGHNLIGCTSSELTQAVENAIKPQQKDSLARKALKFIKPAKSNPGSSIEGGGAIISAQSISDAPSDIDIELQDDDESQTPYQKCRIEIRATDKDRTKVGWAGQIPGIWEKRLKMQIYPTIEPADIYGKDFIVGDIILVSKRLADGVIQPVLFHLVNVYDNE